MTPGSHTRRDLLKGAAALAAAATVGAGDATMSRPAHAQGSTGPARARIDGVLRQAADAKEVPGVVAMAATDKGVLYEGAFGPRVLEPGAAAMTVDTVFRIASMTKVITSVAAMQLVEQGKLKLEDPVPNVDPALGSPQVLEGFDTAGAPKLRPAKRPITLRHLLTHTAGFSYDIWDASTGRYVKSSGMPARATAKVGVHPHAADLRSGRALGVRRQHRLGRPARRGDQRPAARRLLPGQDLRAARHEGQRLRALGRAARAPGPAPPAPGRREPRAAAARGGAGGARSSGRAAARSTRRAATTSTFLQMLLHGGTWKGARILRPETIALMQQNHTGSIPAGIMKTRTRACPTTWISSPGAPIRWGLGYMLNLEPGPNGRSAGTVSWGGIFNTYYWLDPAKRVTGLIMTQILPFADQRALRLYGQFESAVYEALPSA